MPSFKICPALRFEFVHSNWDAENPAVIEFESYNPDWSNRESPQFFESLDNQIDPLFFGLSSNGEDYCAVVGKNATGKTTFLKSIVQFFKFHNNRIGRKEFESFLSGRGVKEFNCIIEYVIHSWAEDEPGIYVIEILNPYLEQLQERIIWEAIENWYSDLKHSGIELDDEEQYWYDQLSERGFTDSLNYEEYLKIVSDHKNKPFFWEFFDDVIDSESKIVANVVTKYNSESGLSFHTELVLNAQYSAFHLPDQTFHSTSDRLDEHSNFHETVIRLLPSLFSNANLKYTIQDNIVFNHPSITCEYISPNQIVEISKELDQSALDLLMEKDESSYGIEDKLSKMDFAEIWSLFEIDKTNEHQLRSFNEISAHESAFSEEFFEFHGSFVLENYSSNYVWDGDKWEELTSQELENKSSKRGRSRNKEGSIFNLYSTPVQCNRNERTNESAEYYAPNKVSVAQILPQSSISYFDHGTDIVRWCRNVIWAEKEGLIYSDCKEQLRDFLVYELHKYLNQNNEDMILSRLYSLDLNEIKAIRSLRELTQTISPYLSSGQAKAFSLAKTCASSDANILLVDEPEISLHIDWQRKIIDVIRKYGSFGYAIFATHSPDVIYHHIDSVVELDSAAEH